jgi:hypothetical protein
MQVAHFDSIGEHWIAMTRECVSRGEIVYDGSVKLLELTGVGFCITHPSAADPLVAQFGKPEMVEAMRKNFIESEAQFGYNFGYGERIWKGGAASPYAAVLSRLKKKPEAKSAVFSMLQESDSTGGHVPCIVALDFKIRYAKVHLHYFARSQDVYKKSYADNLALLTVLERLADDLQLEVGSISGYIASAHCYSEDLAQALLAEPFWDLRATLPSTTS